MRVREFANQTSNFQIHITKTVTFSAVVYIQKRIFKGTPAILHRKGGGGGNVSFVSDVT